MEFRQLRYFVAAVDEGHVGRAAERLHVSQPAVSRQIQALEQELGADLLIRNPYGVTLTDVGEVFYADAQRILAQARDAAGRAGAVTRGELGRLNVAFFGSTVYQAVPECLLRLHRLHPEIACTVTRMGKTRQLNAIREGEIHIGFGRFYPATPDLSIRHVGSDATLAAVPSGHALAGRASVTLAELSAEPLVAYPAADRPNLTDEIMSIFRERQLDVTIEHIANDSTSALCMVACSQRCTLVPETMARLRYPGIEFVPISDCDRKIRSSCVYRSEDRSPVLLKLLETIESTSD